jgi:hypothetical protein
MGLTRKINNKVENFISTGNMYLTKATKAGI